MSAPEPAHGTGTGTVVREEAQAVREEDAFDVGAVHRWLVEHDVHDIGGADGPVPEVKQFGGGASNLTYLLRYPDRELVLRRAPRGKKAKGAHDMRREHDVQAALEPVFPKVAHMVAFAGEDRSPLGAEIYVMDRVPGLIVRRDLPEGVRVDEAEARRLAEAFVDGLADLHGVDVSAAGLDDLSRGDGYARRQVDGWNRRYRDARTWNAARLEGVMRWLDERCPADVDACLIHNDWRMDNLVLDPDDLGSIRAVLDWEMATVGDPLMDLGGAMAYWVQADDPRGLQLFRRQPSNLPGMPTRQELVRRYAERTGRTVSDEDWAFYAVFGHFRLAAIVQQIYARYHAKQTTNPKFRRYWLATHLLGRECRRIMRQAG